MRKQYAVFERIIVADSRAGVLYGGGEGRRRSHRESG